MQETIIHPPRTAMEVFKILPEGTLAEVINGQLYMSPSPIGKHQRLAAHLFLELGLHIRNERLGELFFPPFDVYLDENENAVQPDLIFVTNEKLSIINDHGFIEGVPDLLIEILSPGSAKMDTVTKKELYERFGVTEYWVIDPTSRLATGYVLENSKYVLWREETGALNSKILNHSFSF